MRAEGWGEAVPKVADDDFFEDEEDLDLEEGLVMAPLFFFCL